MIREADLGAGVDPAATSWVVDVRAEELRVPVERSGDPSWESVIRAHGYEGARVPQVAFA